MKKLCLIRLTLLIAVLSCVVGTTFAPAASDDETQPANQKKVTLQLSDAPVIDAIDYLFKNSGYKYTIEPGVSGIISLGLKDVPFEQAVKNMANSADIDYQVKDNLYTFTPKPKAVTVTTVSPTETSPAVVEDEITTIDTEESANIDVPVGEEPIFYGTEYPEYYPEMPYVYQTGNFMGFDYLPPGMDLTNSADNYGEVPPVLPPMSLRSASVQRFIDQMDAVRNIPGFYPYWQHRYLNMSPYFYPW